MSAVFLRQTIDRRHQYNCAIASKKTAAAVLQELILLTFEGWSRSSNHALRSEARKNENNI